MTCIRPAGRRGACSCGNQYAQILDRLDTVEQEASDAKTTAQTAANTASIQAANAAADAAQAASDANDALTQAGNAAASAAAAALDAGNAAADLASINSTISSTLTTYLGTKVDKLTTTGSFAYTHTNATQGETALVDGTTSNTIPIRDGNGRMQAADPASGATDKTLVTTNWVSQTGDSSPNNCLHRSGAETKTGKLTTTAGITLTGTNYNTNSLHARSGSYERDYIVGETDHDLYGLFYDDKNGNNCCIDYMRKNDPVAFWEKYFTFKDSNGNTYNPNLRVEWNATTKTVKLIAFGTTLATRTY